MSRIEVIPLALTVAAGEIDRAATLASVAGDALTGSQVGAFGSEPIAAAFAGMQGRAQQATQELAQTVGMLSRNVAAAAQGYLVTDHGIVAEAALPGFQP